MKRIMAVLASACLLVTVAGCGQQSGMQATGGETGTGTQAPKRNKRGNIVKHVGDEAGITGDDGKDVADWTVTGITIDAKCTNPSAEPAKNGHYIEFDVTATTTGKFDPNKYGSLSVGEPYMWKYIKKDGTQWNDMPGSSNATECMTEAENLPHAINQGVKAKGKVVFDVPDTDGTLVYTQGSPEGWEYPLGK